MIFKSLFIPLFVLIKNNAIVAGLSYLLTISLANYLGPNDFGIYSHVLIVAAFVSILINFGTDQTSPSFYSRVQDIRIVFSITYLLRIFLALTTLLILLIFYYQDVTFFIFLFCLVLANLNLSFLYEIQQRNQKYSYIFLFERLIYIGIIFFLLYIDFINLPKLFAVLLIVTLVSIGYQFFENKNLILCDIRKYKFACWKCLKENFPIVVVALFTYVYGGFGRLILEERLGSERLGIYSAGWQIITIGTIFQAQVVRLWRTKLSICIDAGDHKSLKEWIIYYLIFATVPMFLVAITISIFSEKIVRFLFIPAYSELSTLLPILGFYFLVINFASLIDILWIALRKNSIYMYANIFGGATLLIYLLVFSSDMGMYDFSVATVIGHLFTTLLLTVIWLIYFRRKVLFNFSK